MDTAQITDAISEITANETATAKAIPGRAIDLKFDDSQQARRSEILTTGYVSGSFDTDSGGYPIS